MGNGDCSSSWLDELLCEYVDGAMDPAVRAAFEECLHADPVLARQVERLRCTRTLLCRHGCQVPAPRGLQARVRRRLASEMMHPEPPYFPEAASRLGAFVAAGSVMAAALMIGMMVGAAFLAPRPLAPVADRAPTPSPTMQQEPFDGPYPAAMTPLKRQAPVDLPLLLGEPAATPLRLTPYGQLQGAALRRTGGTP